MSRLPRADRPRRGQFAAYEIGYFHVDIAELRTAREKMYLYVAVDRTSKVAFARVYRRATALLAAASGGTLAHEAVTERPRPQRWVAPQGTRPELAVARFARSLDTAWRRTSYSGLTAAAHHAYGAAPAVADEPEGAGIQDEPGTAGPPPPDDDAAPAGAWQPRAVRLALLADGLTQPAWVAQVLDAVLADGAAVLVGVAVLTADVAAPRPDTSSAQEAYLRLDARRYARPDAPIPRCMHACRTARAWAVQRRPSSVGSRARHQPATAFCIGTLSLARLGSNPPHPPPTATDGTASRSVLGFLRSSLSLLLSGATGRRGPERVWYQRS